MRKKHLNPTYKSSTFTHSFPKKWTIVHFRPLTSAFLVYIFSKLKITVLHSAATSG